MFVNSNPPVATSSREYRGGSRGGLVVVVEKAVLVNLAQLLYMGTEEGEVVVVVAEVAGLVKSNLFQVEV